MSSWMFDPARRTEGVEAQETNTGKTRSSTGSNEVAPKKEDRRRGCLEWFKNSSGNLSSDGLYSGWKPLSMSKAIFSAIIILSLLLAAVIETLAQRSAAAGGLALSPSLDDIPVLIRYAYLYVPTIVAVLYSLIWSWIDLDVKRMQPWFELSKPGGALAASSLFLDYQYDFVAFVPHRAAKRRHWPVFFVGTTMILVLWFLTPLQSALLGTGVVLKSETVVVNSRSKLPSLANQTANLGSEFLNNGYAIAWLNQPLPPFTTSEYALLPFHVEDSPAPTKVNTSLIATTTKLSTSIKCWPAEIEKSRTRTDNTFHFLNGQGCNTTVNFDYISYDLEHKYSMFYIGYYTSPYSSYCLGSPQCPPTANSTHQLLATWFKMMDPENKTTSGFDVSGVFCQPTYLKQQVLAKVDAETLRPDDDFMQPLAPPEVLTEAEFNSSAFEFVLANGMPDKMSIHDTPFQTTVEQLPRLNSTGLGRPTTNMVGFALAGQNYSVEDYSSPEMLERIYNRAHQYLFSTAIDHLLTNDTDFSNSTATAEFPLTGVIVSRAFSIATEALLVIVAIFTGMLMWFCRAAPCNLQKNPSSIGRVMDIFRENPDLAELFGTADNSDDDALRKKFEHDHFELRYDEVNDKSKLLVKRGLEIVSDHEVLLSTARKGYYKPIRPLALRPASGIAFVLVLIGAIVGISYLKRQEQIWNGLTQPSKNFEVSQIVENYIPTIFATLVEPFWVLLNRLLCGLQPFRDLWAGKAKPANSVDATYTSIPPQLVFFRAIKSCHFVLVLVCTMALLSNLLAVGLGALFNEEPVWASYDESMTPAFAPRFDNHSVSTFSLYNGKNMAMRAQYSDHMLLAMLNRSSGTVLPPWITQEYFFQRYIFEDSEKMKKDDVYNVYTRGFGANFNCVPTSPRIIPVNVTTVNEQEANVTCPDHFELAGARMRESILGNIAARGMSSTEYIETASGSTINRTCNLPITLGWGRTPKAEEGNGTVEASFVTCRPTFETAMFNVTIDSTGHVLSYKRATELRESLDYDDSANHTSTLFTYFNSQVDNSNTEWHNDTIIRDWSNYLFSVTDGNRSIIDPKLPVPDPERIAPIVDDVFRQLYALMLGLNEQLFEEKDKGPQITATRRTQEIRVFMEKTAFIIVVVVLGLNVTVAVLVYLRAVVFVLPRMPTTLGSIIAYIAPSRAASSPYRTMPGQTARTFSFGRYVGRDGGVHIGIEMDPHVVPIDPASLKEKKSVFRRLRWKKSKGDVKPGTDGTWL